MPETPAREVKAEPEVLNLNDAPPTEDDDEDEEVVPPVEEGDEPTKDEEPGKEPAESSPEGAEEPEPEAPGTPQAPSKQPAPVPGETPREKALRSEIVTLRTKLRGKVVKDLVGEGAPPIKTTPEVDARMTKLRETYSEEEIRNMEEAIDVLASSKGYVKQQQTYQTAVNDVVDQFITDNSEYKPENDVEDVRWNKFQEILASGIYNVQGKTPKELRVIFNKVHKDVNEALGEAAPVSDKKKDDAQRQKIKSVSHSGGTKSTPTGKQKNIDPGVRSIFKGFDDEDLTEE